MKANVETYSWDNIQKVYRRFAENPRSVVYSIDDGLTWSSPGMDTGKWGSGLEPEVYSCMLFAFLEMKVELHRKRNTDTFKF